MTITILLVPFTIFQPQEVSAVEITHYYEENITCATTGATADVITVTDETDFSFVDGRKYLIIATGIFGIDTVQGNGGYQLLHGSTIFDGSIHTIEPDGAHGGSCANNENFYDYTYFTVWDPVGATEAGEDIILQAHEDGGDTVVYDQATISIIEISESLTEGVTADWAYNFNTNDDTLGTSWNTNNDATLTITPTNNNDDWLVMCGNVLTTDSANKVFSTRINAVTDSDATTIQTQEGEDTNLDAFVQTAIRVFTVENSAHQFDCEAQRNSGGGGGGTRTYSQIFIMNLDAFNTDSNFFSATDETYSTSSFTEIYTLAHQPAVAGDQLIISCEVFDNNSSGFSMVDIRMQVDNTDQPDQQTTQADDLPAVGWDPRDRIQTCRVVIVNLDTTSHNIDVDGSVGGGTPFSDEQVIVAFSMELPSAGVNYIVDELDVYKSSSTTLDTGTAVCLDVSITSGGTCVTYLINGETYRFEFRVTNSGGTSGTPTNAEFRSSVANLDVLGTIVTGDLGGAGCGANSDWTDTVVTTRVDWNSGTTCAITSGGDTEEFFVIVTIDTDADEGTATFFIDDATNTDESGTITFHVDQNADNVNNTGCCLFFINPLIDFVDFWSTTLLNSLISWQVLTNL